MMDAEASDPLRECLSLLFFLPWPRVYFVYCQQIQSFEKHGWKTMKKRNGSPCFQARAHSLPITGTPHSVSHTRTHVSTHLTRTKFTALQPN